MKIIGGIKKEIILDDNDVIIISSMKGNKVKLQVSCNSGSLQIDDLPIEKIKNIQEEEIAIEAMKKYQKEKLQK